MSPELHRSARKHYERDHLDDAKIHYATQHVVNSRPLDDEDDPRRWLLIASDPSGLLLEIVLLVFDNGHEIVIHAMKARKQYLTEL